ncbi:MAG: hypothetical protein QM767_22955 [Anaeromyxobacter sp.]
MKTPSLLDDARQAVTLATRSGAAAAAATLGSDRDVEVSWRDGKLEKLSEATSRALALELYVDGRYSRVVTSDLRPDALSRFVEDAVALARVLSEDPARQLPERALKLAPPVELELEDPGHAAVDAPRRRALVQRIEAAARAAPGAGALLSATAAYSDNLSEVARVHSDGFEATRRSTTFWASAPRPRSGTPTAGGRRIGTPGAATTPPISATWPGSGGRRWSAPPPASAPARWPPGPAPSWWTGGPRGGW